MYLVVVIDWCIRCNWCFMKLFFGLIISLFSGLAQAGQTFSFDAKSLDAATESGIFFDPHNHTNGVLGPLAVVNAYKFIWGQQPSEAELKNFWFKFLEHYNKKTDAVDELGNPKLDEAGKVVQKVNKLKSGDNLSNGTKLLLNCNEPEIYCSSSLPPGEESGELCMNSLLRNITNILAATPLTSFSGAYAVRRTLVDIPDLDGHFGVHVQQQATILELALAKIALVEMSQPFAGGPDGEKKLASTVLFYSDILKDLRATKTSASNQGLKNRFTQLDLQVPQIKWLLLTPTKDLGENTENTTLSYASGQCREYPVAASAPGSDTNKDIYNVLVKFADVVGIDVAGPEYTCFAPRGMEEFKKLAGATYQAAMVRQKDPSTAGKLVVRVHVGEGSPVEDAERIITLSDDARKESCEKAKEFPKIKQVHDRNEMIYIHQLESRKNIDYILQVIDELKKQYKDIDQYVIFRLGHLTHITKEQAKRAKELGITADVNLSSNVSTQAWTVDPAIINKYLVEKGIKANNIRSLLVALVDNGASYEEIFKGHGLKWLLLNKVPTVLGSDGAGVEHAPSLKREYFIANELIKAWNQSDPEFKKQDISIDFLLKNQKNHFDQMKYKY